MFKKKVFEYNGHQIRQGADLSGADLSGLVGRDVLVALGSLEDLNFANANLTGANFDGLELHKVNFAGANLTEASFKKCWLHQGRKHVFSGANLSNTTITTAHDLSLPPEWWSFHSQTIFTGANLDRATLGGHFSNFVFTDASLRGARISSGTRFFQCEFVGTDFSGSHFEGDQTFPFSLQNNPCLVSFSKLAGAKFVDVTGCAYFDILQYEDPPPAFKVTDGTFYLSTLVVGHSPDYKSFQQEPNPQNPAWSPPGFFVALTPQGFIPRSSAKQSHDSGVESELAEVKRLLDGGLIDQAEHDALRRKILGI